MKVVLESRQILVACKMSASFKTLPIRPRVQWRGMMRNGSQENTFEPEQIANCKYIDKQVTLESRDLLIRGCLKSFFELSHQTLSWHDQSLMSGRKEFPLLFFPLLQTELNYKVLFFFFLLLWDLGSLKLSFGRPLEIDTPPSLEGGSCCMIF